MDVGLVCDACNTFNPMGSKACARCEAGLSLEAAPSADGASTCPVCHAAMSADLSICARCGGAAERAEAAPGQGSAPETGGRAPAARSGGRKARTMQFSALQTSRAKLTLIKGDGLDGVSFTLAGDEHHAGRRDDLPLSFADDPLLSPMHANFFYRGGLLMVRDEGSTNGVFTRIRRPVPLEVGDRFLVGEQLLEVQSGHVDPAIYAPREDGTYAYGSPHIPSNVVLVQVLRGGATGLRYRVPGDRVFLGREDNDIDFPDDPFISGEHAEVSCGGGITLTDLQSRNGTFVRIRGEHPLEHGDYVFMGQQLLRVEIV